MVGPIAGLIFLHTAMAWISKQVHKLLKINIIAVTFLSFAASCSLFFLGTISRARKRKKSHQQNFPYLIQSNKYCQLSRLKISCMPGSLGGMLGIRVLTDRLRLETS